MSHYVTTPANAGVREGGLGEGKALKRSSGHQPGAQRQQERPQQGADQRAPGQGRRANNIQRQAANQLAGNEDGNGGGRPEVLIAADAGKTKNEPSRPGSSDHQLSRAASS